MTESTRSQAIRDEVEAWAGTILRWLGVAIIIYGVFVDRGKNPAVVTTGLTLALLKSLGLGKNGNGKRNGTS